MQIPPTQFGAHTHTFAHPYIHTFIYIGVLEVFIDLFHLYRFVYAFNFITLCAYFILILAKNLIDFRFSLTAFIVYIFIHNLGMLPILFAA